MLTILVRDFPTYRGVSKEENDNPERDQADGTRRLQISDKTKVNCQKHTLFAI